MNMIFIISGIKFDPSVKTLFGLNSLHNYKKGRGNFKNTLVINREGDLSKIYPCFPS